MDFFTVHDWLGREGPYNFKLDHILFIVIGLFLGFLLAFLLKNKSKKTVKTWLICLWAFGTAVEAFYYIGLAIFCNVHPELRQFSIESMLPLHSCLMFMYIFPFAMFSKNRIVKTAASNWLVVVNMIMGFITLFVGCPTKGYSALSFDGIQSMIIHIIIVVVPFIMLVTNYYDLQKGDLKYGLALFGSLALTIWIFDHFAHCDYFFIYDGRTFGVLYVISENVPHIVWTLITVTCYVLTAIIIHYLIVLLKNRGEEIAWPFKKCWYRIYQKVLKFAMGFMNWSEPELLKGEDSVLKLPQFIKDKNINKVLVVTDKGLMSIHLLDPMLNELKNVGVDYVFYDGVQPNPTIPNIEECRELYLKNDCQGFIAFGGGSPMDCAKAAAARIVRPHKTVRQMRGYLKVGKKLPPFFAVPTTAGTGSETTLAAVVSDPQTHEKNAICDGSLRPKYAVLDPMLTIGLPPHITSTTGMDALTHAVEAYIGKGNVKSTIKYSEEAVKLIHNNLEVAFKDGKNIKARDNMLYASYLAGNAFTRAFVGYVHAIAHNLGGMYGTPHGLANAVILPHVLQWYGPCIYPQLAKLADIIGITNPDMLIEEKAKSYIDEIKRMNKAMNIPEQFDFIKAEDIPTLVKRALKEGNPGYPVPRIMNSKDCENLIRSLMSK